jgi:hypothetical protein
MYTSRKAKPAVKARTAIDKKVSDRKPQLEEYLKNHDYTGAIVLLEYQNNVGNVIFIVDIFCGGAESLCSLRAQLPPTGMTKLKQTAVSSNSLRHKRRMI